MDVDHARAEQFLLPCMELRLDVMRHHHALAERYVLRVSAAVNQSHRRGRCGVLQRVGLLSSGNWSNRGSETGDGLVHHAAHVEVGVAIGIRRVVALQNVLQQRPLGWILLEYARVKE